jgi:hypothetical protein
MRMRVMAMVAAAAGFSFAGSSMAAITIVNNIPGTFIDISPAGNGLGIDSGVHGDDLSGSIPINTGNIIMPAGNNYDNVGPPPGTIYYANMPGVTIVQWNNIGTFAGGTGTGTFQIQIFDGSSGILAQYIYPDVDFGGTGSFAASATIGAVADVANGFAQWSFNTASIQNGSVLTILPAPGSLALLGLGGLLASRRRR